MKFLIIQDKINSCNTWNLVTNSGTTIASSSTAYVSVSDAQKAIEEFKIWVNQAPVNINVVEPINTSTNKDWRQQAIEQLKKTRKG